MKKFLFVCAVLFIGSVGCKKMNIDGNGLCACSPITQPELTLVIKNAAGDDLLNDKTTGAFTKEKVELYTKDGAGKVIPVTFSIRPPFSYGDEKFNFYQLNFGLGFMQNKNSILYLKLGEGKVFELTFELNEGSYALSKLLIDQKEAQKDLGTVLKYKSIFYFTP